MKNSVEEAKNITDANAPSGVAVKQAREGRSGNGTDALASRFTILKQVGASASARLYLAKENQGRSAGPVMIKVLHHDAVKDPTELVSFLLEARAAARLSHDNIIKARSAEQVGGIHFYVVEHKADAETLRETLDQRGWLDIDRAIKLANQLSDALECAHGCGILHLEIEPNKILFDSDGKAMLTGFGVDARKQFEWAHRKRSVNCPFAYLSPEQLDGGVADQRSDLYSLGVTLYEALTDRLPFNAESAYQIRQKISSQKVQPPHLLRSDVPEALSGVVTRLISKDPSERFQDAASLKSALTELLDPVSQQFVEESEPPREVIRDEMDYTRTRELVSEPPAAFRQSDGPRSHKSVKLNDDGDEKNEADQGARFQSPSTHVVAPPKEDVHATRPKASPDKRAQSDQHAPSIKTFDTGRSPLSLRLAIFAIILVGVMALCFFAYRNRLIRRNEGAQPLSQPAAGAGDAKVEAKDPAPAESKKNDSEGNQTSSAGQPDSSQQRLNKSGGTSRAASSTRLKSAAQTGVGSAQTQTVRRQRGVLRRQRVGRRSQPNKGRYLIRNIYKRH